MRRIHYDALPAWAPCMRGHVHEKRPTRGVSTSYIYIYIYVHLNNASKLAWTRRTASIRVIYGYPYLSFIGALPVRTLDVAENSILVNNTHL